MNYKGFVILPEYDCCSDCSMDKNGDFIFLPNGEIKSRRPTKKDIKYYVIYDPINNMNRWITEETISMCKGTINGFLSVVGMKDNTQKSWDKL